MESTSRNDGVAPVCASEGKQVPPHAIAATAPIVRQAAERRVTQDFIVALLFFCVT